MSKDLLMFTDVCILIDFPVLLSFFGMAVLLDGALTWRTVVISLVFWESWVSSIIRQKGKSEQGGNKKTKYAKFSEKPTFITP